MRKLLVLLLLFASFAEARVLKQSTATTVNIGPFRKITDGTNEDTVMSGSGMSISFIKQSDTLASTVTTVSATNSGGSVNDCVLITKGTYNCEITATNTDTLGRLDIIAASTGTYGSRISFDVVSADSYAFTVQGDIMDISTFLNSAAADVTNTSGVFYPIRNVDTPTSTVDTDVIAVPALVWAVPSTSVGSVTGSVGSVVGAVGSVTAPVVVGSISNGAITANALGSDALTAAKVAADVGSEIRTGLLTVPKNVIYSNFVIEMVDSADGTTLKTGLAITCQVSKDGAALATCANPVTEIGNGLYKTDVSSGDLNGDEVWLRFTAATARRLSFKIRTQR